MKRILILSAAVFMAQLSFAQTVTSTNKTKERRPSEPPTIDELFSMDENNDGKLSKSEVSGPLLNDFSKIDTNEDGFITREELEKAPKPNGTPRPGPPRN